RSRGILIRLSRFPLPSKNPRSWAFVVGTASGDPPFAKARPVSPDYNRYSMLGKRPSVARILTYNVHRCLGGDGHLSPARIAEVIARSEPDIVALQELDVNRARTRGVDQAAMIADELSMQLHFHPALRVMEELYGDAILTDRRSRLVKAGALPNSGSKAFMEPRGAFWVSIELDGIEIQVINTHLGLRAQER